MKIKYIFGIAIFTAILSSCSIRKSTHSYRMIEEDLHGKTSVKLANSYEADLDIDFTKEIKGETSESHKSEKLARSEAYYNAITKNGVHVLINPIYKVSQVGEYFDCNVVGFGAKYSNPRASGTQESEGGEDTELDLRLAQLERFSKIEGVQDGLKKSSYTIDTREGCCGEAKEGSMKYGETNLLHAIDNKASLVDEFIKFVQMTESMTESTNTQEEDPKTCKVLRIFKVKCN